MISRFASFVIVLYALGFVLFAFTLAKPAPADSPQVDAVVVLTGAKGRIEHGVDVLRHHQAKRMFVAGADPSVIKADIARRLPGRRALVACCVDLGSQSVDTRSNANEAQAWLDKQHYRSFRLVTSNWHMRRALFEFRSVLGSRYSIQPDAVAAQPAFTTLFGEYNKYLLRRMSAVAGI
jgi:uncharacterized SAM-binding protein YcdF (DUF218 family)